MRQRANQGLSKIWKWFISTDPGLNRLRMATWAILTAGISYLVLSSLSELLGQPSAIYLLGVIIGVSAVAVNDPDLPDQRITTLLIPLPAVAAAVLGELASPIAWIEEVVLLAVVFAAVRMRQFGARGTVLGLVFFITYLFSFNLNLRANQFPWAVISILLGTLIVFLVRFELLPARPDVIFQQSAAAFLARAKALLETLISLVQNPQRQERYAPILGKQLYKIGELAIELEYLLGPAADSAAIEDPVEAWRANLLEVEMALETLVEVTGQIVGGKLIATEKLAALAHFLRVLHAAVQSKTPEHPLQADILQVYRGEPDNSALNLAIRRMEWAAHSLIEHDPWQVPKEVEARLKTTNIVSPHPPTAQASAENLKLAVQATMAVGLAILAGVLISATRWYWAVIAAFVLFVRASTIEQTIARAWQRVAGTLVGVVVGILLVQFIIDDPRLEVILLLAGFFTAYFLATLTYTGFVFVLTIVLAILYRLLGSFQPGLLVLRLEETLAGAAVGVLVALFIFPKYSSTKNQETMTKVMQKISQSLEPMIPNLEAGESFEPLRSMVREIDQEVKTLRGAISSLGGSFLSLCSPETRVRVHKLSLLGLAIRHYRMASRLSQPDDQLRQQTSAIEHRLAQNAITIANALEAKSYTPIQPTEDLLNQALQTTPSTADTPIPGAAWQWLARISQLESEIAKDMNILQ